tara:strand:+ start:87 stop:1130 length:1044 start_codon:yes stop_codon:yes gene_type:complete
MSKKIIITGGAGFIGINASKKFMDEGYDVIIFDNLSRDGTDKNLRWLMDNPEKSDGKLSFFEGDVTDFNQVKKCFSENGKIDVVLNLAAQVAVTTSVINPRKDFEVNALGTFNICEAVRKFQPDTILLNSSTNKVYGEMEEIKVIEELDKYAYSNLKYGISEKMNLDFHSPYGCSKGAADQYIRDYSRIYNIKTVNFRQSCIYGPHQFGVEDQGWVAWFTICASLKKPITIFGDGKQIRDVLFVDDLIDCYLKSIDNIEKINGKHYNIGGGPQNTLSLLQLLCLLDNFFERKINISFDDWRPGDQKVFICDIRKAEKDFGWKPTTDPKCGVEKLSKWILENKKLFIK